MLDPLKEQQMGSLMALSRGWQKDQRKVSLTGWQKANQREHRWGWQTASMKGSHLELGCPLEKPTARHWAEGWQWVCRLGCWMARQMD